MAKKHPAYLTARVDIRIPAGQDGVWAAARKLRAFTISDIEDLVDSHRETIGDYLRRLERGGFLRRLSAPPPGAPVQYELVEDQAETPRLRGDGALIADPRGGGQDNMWRAMKMLRDFDACQLAQAAKSDGVTVAVTSAGDYLRALHAAGYLILVSEGRGGHKSAAKKAVYALDPRRNSGPQAPRIMRTKAIFDPNDGRIFSLPDPAERVTP